ncbi:MAG: SRPBCC family protein [Acidovorax sp.]|uniref:SRPBCC family protein n=1 Tax=Acidovorax sp. TaxID=1872122 RepID=UPI0039E66905
MPTGTVHLHRVLRTTPDKVFRAFTHSAALAKWLPPYGFVCHVHQFDGQVGGSFRMSFENFTTGHSHSFGGEYVKLVPGEFIEYTDRFDDPSMPGKMRVTVQLRAVSCGTEVRIEQAGIPELIPTEGCYLGWQESLAQLAQLVEPDITG